MKKAFFVFVLLVLLVCGLYYYAFYYRENKPVDVFIKDVVDAAGISAQKTMEPTEESPDEALEQPQHPVKSWPEQPKKTQKALKKPKKRKIPKGWDKYLWRACWDKKRKLVDFTRDEWQSLSTEEQGRLARSYQKWYAQWRDVSWQREIEAAGTRLQMALIPPGQFFMGSLEIEADRDVDEIRHPVVISKPFWLGQYEVTQQQWQEVTGERPWAGQKNASDNPRHAVSHVSWNEVAQKFLARLGKRYHLPTEAQWEYACRAGTSERFYWGESIAAMGNYANIADKTAAPHYPGLDIADTEDGFQAIAPVGSLVANPFGLHDMIGNVYEWCNDWYRDSYYSTVKKIDPHGPKQASERVLRGGSWYYGRLGYMRSANRFWAGPDWRDHDIGVRVALE